MTEKHYDKFPSHAGSPASAVAVAQGPRLRDSNSEAVSLDSGLEKERVFCWGSVSCCVGCFLGFPPVSHWKNTIFLTFSMEFLLFP